MPYNGSGTEANDRAGLLKPPTEVDVISGFAIFHIEAANAFERPPVERHVTPRDMFGDSIGEQDVTRPAWCCGNAGLNPGLCRRCNIRPPYSGEIFAQQR